MSTTVLTAPMHAQRRLSIYTLGMSLGAFFLVSFVLCVLGYLLAPTLPITHQALSIFLPGFELLSWRSFALGAAESIAWGWYIALVFAPLYNFFAVRDRADA